MSILSDIAIKRQLEKGEISIEPLVMDCVQPSSIDLTLDSCIRIFKPSVVEAGEPFDLKKESSELFTTILVDSEIGYVLCAGDFILAQVSEYIKISDNFNATLHGRSSLARLGIDVSAASYINPGYEGKLPIAIKNNSPIDIIIYPGMRICQLEIQEVKPTPSVSYASKIDAKYLGERDDIFSKVQLDKELMSKIKAAAKKNYIPGS